MKPLTKKQKKELEVWRYFAPKNCQWKEETPEDIKMFFEWSEQGKNKTEALIHTYLPEGRTGFHKLVWGKKWSYIHIHELYEPSFLDNSWIGYAMLVEDMPRSVADFLKKEMFKGKDAEVIEHCYSFK